MVTERLTRTDVRDGACYLRGIHHGFDGDIAVGLLHARGHPLRKLREGIADVDLAACDVVLATVERDAFRQTGDGVLGAGIGCRVRARCVGRDGAVVDDAPAAPAFDSATTRSSNSRRRPASATQ